MLNGDGNENGKKKKKISRSKETFLLQERTSVVKRNNIAIQLVLQQCCKTIVARFTVA